MNNLTNQIINYIPYNEQEIKDKEYFLFCLKTFDNLITRENKIVHFTSSALVLNKKRNKMLVVHHNTYKALIYPGGHADGEEDLLSVAIREVEEETGIKSVPISNNIFSIQCLPVKGHIKKDEYISAHIDLDVMYLLEADDKKILKINESENSLVKWIPLEKSYDKNIVDYIRPINKKIIEKIKNLNK